MENLICLWCNEHKLLAEYNRHGVYLRCETPAEFNCADATGTFKTLEEAIDCVKEMAE